MNIINSMKHISKVAKTILFGALIVAMILPFSSMGAIMPQAAADTADQFKDIKNMEQQIADTKKSIMMLQGEIYQTKQGISQIPMQLYADDDYNNTTNNKDTTYLQKAPTHLEKNLIKSKKHHLDLLDAKISALYEEFDAVVLQQATSLNQNLKKIYDKKIDVEDSIKQKQQQQQYLAANDKERSQILQKQIQILEDILNTLDAQYDKTKNQLDKIRASSINSMRIDPHLEEQLKAAGKKITDIIVSELKKNPDQEIFLGLPIQGVTIDYTTGELVISLDKSHRDAKLQKNSLGVVAQQGNMAFTDTLSNFNLKGIPLRMDYEDPIERESCQWRDDDCRPLWGGTKIRNSLYEGCTIGFPVTQNNGNKGFVTAGHCYPVGSEVYQPYPPYPIGVVSKNNFNLDDWAVWCDCAFVSTNTLTEDKIFKERNTGFSISSKNSDDLEIGDLVRSSGASTDRIVEGKITEKPFYTKMSDKYGEHHYFDLIKASYYSQTGDSGAPVMSMGTKDVTIHGMHVAHGAYFEPWNDIKTNLDLR